MLSPTLPRALIDPEERECGYASDRSRSSVGRTAVAVNSTEETSFTEGTARYQDFVEVKYKATNEATQSAYGLTET